MATPGQWLAGARPRTLTAAVVPPLVGAALAFGHGADGDQSWAGGVSASRLGVAVALALLLQVGVNYANDYSDGIRGSDDRRVGPARLVASGLAEPTWVRLAAWLCFAAALALGVLLSLWIGWEALAVVAVSVLAAWFYTGGPRPYGYHALGELMVLVFFGLVPTVGVVYLLTGDFTARAFVAGAGVGMVACALLVVNNLRDVDSDRAAGKFTLAVVLTRAWGHSWARRLYSAAWIAAALAVAVLGSGLLGGQGAGSAWALLGLAAPLGAVPVCRQVLAAPASDLAAPASDPAAPAPDPDAAAGPLLDALTATGKLLLAYGISLGAGLWLAEILS